MVGKRILFILCFTILICSCKKKEEKDVISTDELVLVFDEPFDNNNNNWWLGQTAYYSSDITNGSYNLTSNQDTFYTFAYLNVNYNTGNNYRIDMELSMNNSSLNGYGGLYWDIYGSSQANYFIVANNGKIAIGYISNNIYYHIIDWSYPPESINVTEPNVLSVLRTGSEVQYFINMQKVGSEEYRKMDLRNVGFEMNGKGEMNVHHIKVYD